LIRQQNLPEGQTTLLIEEAFLFFFRCMIQESQEEYSILK